MHKTDLKWVKIARIWHKYDFYGKIWEMSSYMPATALPNSKTWSHVLIVQGQVYNGWLVYNTMLYCMSMSASCASPPSPYTDMFGTSFWILKCRIYFLYILMGKFVLRIMTITFWILKYHIYFLYISNIFAYIWTFW